MVVAINAGCLQLWKTWKSREFANSGKLGEFEIYSVNSCISDAVFFVTQSVTQSKPTCKFARLQWYLCELLVMVCRILVDKTGTEMAAKVIHYIRF